MTLNQQAWDYLTDDEKTALSLQYGMEKSSWEVGEIMNKSHYKYLEIKYRAEFFLKTFTEYVELFDCLIPDYIPGDRIVVRYFKICLEQRIKPIEVLEILNKEFGKIHRTQLNEKITRTLKKWQEDKNLFCQNTVNLVKEFDRWNNFRILPKPIQEPSAYKRRIKNTHKKQIKVLNSLHPIAIDKLKKLYLTKHSPYLYIPILGPNPELLMMKVNRNSMEIFNSLGLYGFKKKEEAEKYFNEVKDYLDKGKKECRDGLDFWPVYRELIKKADNYHEVMKINTSRKYLQLAMAKFNLL